MSVFAPAAQLLLLILIGFVLYKASMEDLVTKTVRNIYPASILMLTLFNHWLFYSSTTYLLGLLIAVPFLVAFYAEKIGGADVKLVIALCLYLGLYNGLLFVIASFIFAIVTEADKKRMSVDKTSFPLVPYFVCGYCVASFSVLVGLLKQ